MAAELHQTLGEACQVEEEGDSYGLPSGNYLRTIPTSEQKLTGSGTVEVQARVKITFALQS